MKFLTDENIAISVVKDLRKAGFDVKDIKEEDLYGTSDNEILKIAINENRIVITHDKDFANTLYSSIVHKGIILLRFKNQNPKNISKILLNILTSDINIKIANRIVVITESQIFIHKREK